MSGQVDPFDELAALFLTDAQEEAGGDAPGGPATTELLIVGSLPVRAALWLPPYADHLARRDGPAALLRLDDREPTLQLFRAPAAPALRPQEGLARAIAALDGCVARWLLRPPLDAPPLELVESGADRITILTSANDKAMVEAYQIAKALLEAGRTAGGAAPPLGLAVLGCEPQRAGRMQEQLDRTIASFLDARLPLVECVPRMDATPGAAAPLVFPGPTVAPAEALRWIREPGRAPAPAPAPAAPPRPAEAPAVPSGGAPSVKLAPKPHVEVEPKHPARATQPDDRGAPVSLCSYLDDVEPLDVRCPGHERLELGVDAGGRIHVAAREAAMRELHAVAAWARAHREIIDRLCPDNWIDPAGETILHVFTDRPSTVADLHGTALRLHVLAPVVVEGRRGWYAAPLNAAVP